MNKIIVFLLLFFLFFVSLSFADDTVIEQDTEWSGDIAINGDILVRKGATLTILPGTEIHVSPSDSSKTEPEYLSPLTEITVRGVLKAIGSKESPILFIMPDAGHIKEWAGIFVDGGTATLSWCRIQGAEAGLTIIQGRADIRDSILKKNRYGLTVLGPENQVRVEHTDIVENEYGIALLNGATIIKNNCEIRENKQKDILQPAAGKYRPAAKEYVAGKKDKTTVYDEEALLGTVVWKDRIVVKGVVRVPAKSRLIIMPGTVIEFSKRDTNGDGIGENGLLIMGMLVAKGTAEKPIIFRSAEKNKAMGDWDAINIYVSDGYQNLLEYCQIENAFRALHLHFSNVAIKHCVLRNNMRGLQFQESLVEITDTDIYSNKSSMRARDSEIIFSNNRIYDNYSGPNIFRITGVVRDNTIAANYLDGLRVREGALEVEGNYIVGNRYGLTIAYSVYGDFHDNVISDNYEAGITVKGTDSITVADNFVQGNGGNGISLLNSLAEIRGNHIAGNGERGIGIISFNGVITENNLINNRLYAIGMEGENDISAPGNWWHDADIDQVIYDKNDDPDRGGLEYRPARREPVPFVWPVSDVRTDTVWSGEIHVPVKVTIMAGTTLTIAPGATIKFAKDRGLWADGKILAKGDPDRRILFTAMEETDKPSWHQMTTEYSKATFINCDFEYSNMAVHGHFSNIEIKDCFFRKNESGVRFRGGPVDISQSVFEDNVFGIVAYFAKAHITDNIFTNNDVGIFVRAERNAGLTIRRNNIFDNRRYNLRIGDFNLDENVDARENWWGPADPAAKIFDELDEPDIGLVFYEPFARTPFKLKVKSEK